MTNNTTKEHPTKEHHATAIAGSLQTIDNEITATTGGEPGSGIYSLLNMLAGQFLGVPRSAMPDEKQREKVEADRAKQAVIDEKERERIEAERIAEEKAEANAAKGHHRTK